jgi:hypothetical protein
MTISLAPPANLGTVIVPTRTPLLSTVREQIAVKPPTVIEEIASELNHPLPLTVTGVPTGPEVGEKVADPVTVKALVRINEPLLAPVMTTFLPPPTAVGIVTVPERTPLASTVRE